MIWFAIIWLVVGALAAVLFGLMAHPQQVSADTIKARTDADRAEHKNHVLAH